MLMVMFVLTILINQNYREYVLNEPLRWHTLSLLKIFMMLTLTLPGEQSVYNAIP